MTGLHYQNWNPVHAQDNKEYPQCGSDSLQTVAISIMTKYVESWAFIVLQWKLMEENQQQWISSFTLYYYCKDDQATNKQSVQIGILFTSPNIYTQHYAFSGTGTQITWQKLQQTLLAKISHMLAPLHCYNEKYDSMWKWWVCDVPVGMFEYEYFFKRTVSGMNHINTQW